jgi:hypothetical protein
MTSFAAGFEVLADGRVRDTRFDARVFPSYRHDETSAQVDFVVSDARLAARVLLESFAGFGPTWRSTLVQTIQKFERGDVHVFIAALLDRSMCTDQVTWEKLAHPGGGFDVCLGAQLVLYTNGPGPSITALLDALYLALHDVPLSRAIHGLRLFVWLNSGVLETVEVLLDNEPWAAGEELARRAEWPNVAGHLGTRFFALLVPE